MPIPSDLSALISHVWANHPGFIGAVRVVNASQGQWMPTQQCPTPRLWIFLSGHYRTFSWTRAALAEVAAISSENCYFVAAAVPRHIEAEQRTGKWSPVPGGVWPQIASHNDAAAVLMAESSVAFGGRLAYAVLDRTGAYDRLPAGLAVLWHAVWAVARWVASTRSFLPIDPSAVVVRTRPDVLLRAPFAVAPLQRHFKAAHHGMHLILNQDVREAHHWWAQSEYRS